MKLEHALMREWAANIRGKADLIRRGYVGGMAESCEYLARIIDEYVGRVSPPRMRCSGGASCGHRYCPHRGEHERNVYCSEACVESRCVPVDAPAVPAVESLVSGLPPARSDMEHIAGIAESMDEGDMAVGLLTTPGKSS